MSRESTARTAARHRLADTLQAQGPAWKAAADSLRSGTYGNVWTEAALDALVSTMRQPLDDDQDHD